MQPNSGTRSPFDNVGDMRNILNKLENLTEAEGGKHSGEQAIIIAFSNMPDPAEKYKTAVLTAKLDEMGVFWWQPDKPEKNTQKWKNHRFRCNMISNAKQGKIVTKEEPDGFFKLMPQHVIEAGVIPEPVGKRKEEKVLDAAMDAIDAKKPTAAEVQNYSGERSQKLVLKVKQKTAPQVPPAATPGPQGDHPNHEIVISFGEETMEKVLQMDGSAEDQQILAGAAETLAQIKNQNPAEFAEIGISFYLHGKEAAHTNGEVMAGMDQGQIHTELTAKYTTAQAKIGSESVANFADFVMEFHDDEGKYADAAAGEMIDLGVEGSLDQTTLDAINFALADYIQQTQ